MGGSARGHLVWATVWRTLGLPVGAAAGSGCGDCCGRPGRGEGVARQGARGLEPQPEAVDAARLSPAHRQREVWGAASGAEPTRPPFYPAGYHIWVRGAGGNPDHLVGVRDQLSLAQELQKRTAEELSESGHRSCVFVRRGR